MTTQKNILTKMDNSYLLTTSFVHAMFGMIVGTLIANLVDRFYILKLRSKLDDAIGQVFTRDLEIDELECDVGRLRKELNELKLKHYTPECQSDKAINDESDCASSVSSNMD